MKYDENKYPIIWKRTSSKGYCFTARIPCRIVGTSAKRVRIAALLMKGDERYHTVQMESLIHDPCNCYAECRVIEDLKIRVAQ